MAKFVPKIAEPLLNYVPSPEVENLTSYASKAIRLKIIADRYIRGFDKADRKGGNEAYEHERQDPTGNKPHRQSLGRRDSAILYDGRGHIVSETKTQTSDAQGRGPIVDYISIIDIDYKDEHHDTRYYKKMILPFVPRMLNYDIESNFVGIASFGRNNPFYQYTGSEDTLSFQIDWFSDHNSREDVIFNCRWIEALTKANAYEEPPHRIVLSWGRENKLFDGVVWLVVKASYNLSDFVRGYRDTNGEIVSVGMLPQQAMQEVVLKRLTRTNLSTRDIIGTKRH